MNKIAAYFFDTEEQYKTYLPYIKLLKLGLIITIAVEILKLIK